MDLTTAQVAEKLGISTVRVSQFARAGRLKFSRRVGRAFLFRPADVEKFAAKERKPGRPEFDGGPGGK